VGSLSRERKLDDGLPTELLMAEPCDLCCWKSSEFRLFYKPPDGFKLDLRMLLDGPTAEGRCVLPEPPWEGPFMAVFLVWYSNWVACAC